MRKPSSVQLERLSYYVTIVGFPILLLSMIFVFYQIGELKTVASSQNNIALNSMFFNDSNTGIIDAIENNQPILKENKGSYTDAQLDNYIGDFDTINTAYSEGLLSEDELCDSFSYYVHITTSSTEVQNYMASNSNFFEGLPDLVKTIEHSKDSSCQ